MQLGPIPIGMLTCFQQAVSEIQQRPTLSAMVRVALDAALRIAVLIIESELARRAAILPQWPACLDCGTRLESKGLADRSLLTLAGRVTWRRPVGRCPGACRGQQIVPLDQELAILPNQQASRQVKRLACLLAVFAPYQTASDLLERLTQLKVSASTIWNWVQDAGRRAQAESKAVVEAAEDGDLPDTESGALEFLKQTLLVGCDGVMVPFRPTEGTPKGKSDFRQILIGVVARPSTRLTRTAKEINELKQRRVVARRCETRAFLPWLLVEAIRQGMLEATSGSVAWLSDGANALWDLFEGSFAPFAQGILDFYHAAEYIRKASKKVFGETSEQGLRWYHQLRHDLRHGRAQDVLDEILARLGDRGMGIEARNVLTNLHDYLDRHWDHIQYELYEKAGLPRGSGFVESACKWLIQQRFKGVGMRWSYAGFDNLLALRTAWVNGRFDSLFTAHEGADCAGHESRRQAA